MKVILDDTSKFKMVTEDNTREKHMAVKAWIASHRHLFSESEYNSVFPQSASMPVLYGQPKLHKDGIPLRPVLSMVGSYNHGLATSLSKLLEPMRQSTNVCTDKFGLANMLGQSNLQTSYFVSYDIDSLFTNVPVEETIGVILDHLFPSGTSRRDYTYNGWKRLDLKRALDHCLKDVTFIFQGTMYRQIDGIAMGSPLSSTLADIFINKVFEPLITRDNDYDITFGTYILRFFTRYADDILACFNSESEAISFLEYLNSLHPSLKFKIELEQLDKLPFLDILIIKSNSSIVTTVYRKPTHSGVLTHFNSYVPFRYKRNAIWGLLDRAYKLCSTWECLAQEHGILRDMLMNCGYNREFIYGIVGEYMEKVYQNISPDNSQNEPPVETETASRKPKLIYVNLPFLNETSAKIKKTILGFLRRIDPNQQKFKIIFVDKCSKLRHYFQLKDKLPLKFRSNCIYKLKCSCGKCYIGHTTRNAYLRMEDHAKITGSLLTAVGQHLLENPEHTVDFENPEILGYSPYFNKRIIKEALYIQSHNPALNIQTETKKLILFNVA